MIFKDRHHAGQLLVDHLQAYNDNEDVIVLGLARGGVVTAYEIAHSLHLHLDVICPRKVGAPNNPEFAIGAITELGEPILNEQVIKRLNIPQDYVDATIEEERQQALHRVEIYRKNRPPPEMEDKTIILVDDGLATGSTMKAAIKSLKGQGVKKIVVAVPTSPLDTLDTIQQLVDEVVCLDAPTLFYAIGQFYEEFFSTTDEEVIELLKKGSLLR